MARIAVLGVRLSGVRSGAHLTHLEIARFLEARGHQVIFAALEGEARTRFGDLVALGPEVLQEAVAGADCVMVRDEPRVGRLLAFCGTSRVLYTCHSPAGDPRALRIPLPGNVLLIWVSGVLAGQATTRHGRYRGAQIVIEGCPLDPARYGTTPGGRVALINLSLRKGGALFWRLVDRVAEMEFLGVRGWGRQILRTTLPPNARLMDPVDDPRLFYRETRVLLLPSAETGTVRVKEVPGWGEAWNRVGVEAAISGIPAIAHPAVGIRASLGDAAVYVQREDLTGWVQALRRFQNPAYWEERSAIARAHGKAMVARTPAILDAYESVLRRAA